MEKRGKKFDQIEIEKYCTGKWQTHTHTNGSEGNGTEEQSENKRKENA